MSGTSKVLATVLFALLIHAQARAVADKTNQGRWNSPTENNLPDKEVPGFLVNLGPTGARAILTENTFVVRYIFKNCPAVGKLKIDDEITGVFGKPFSPHHFKGEGKQAHGYEGPIMDFGEAIERAEGKDGKLVLNVKRGSETLEVKIDLEPIGTFSATYPFNCKKSELLRTRALKYFIDHPDSLNVWQAHARAAVALSLISSDDPKFQAAGKDMVMKWNSQSPDGGTWTWNLSYQLITLSEYHLLTRDPAVLPMIRTVSNYLEHAQYNGKIAVWKAKDSEDPAKIDAAQQLYDGGFGHAPYKEGVGKNGYGPMQYTTCLAVIGWQLASRCGVEPGSDYIKRSLGFIHRGTNAAGYVAYGGEFTLNNGLVDPVAWKKSTSGENYVGRTGCAILAHKLSTEFTESAEYLPKYAGYMKHAYKSMPDGHADSNLGIIWGLMGAAASEDNEALRKALDYHKAFFNMMRCHDGSFVLLPGRDYADSGYYMASRYHPTATMALTFGLANPKLLIQGIQVSIPGVNPKALKGRLDTAYKAIVQKKFGDAAAALKGAGSEDTYTVEAMLAYLDAQTQNDVAILGALEKSGDFYQLEKELAKMKTKFGPLASFKEKTARFDDGLRTDEWKAEVRLGTSYQQLVDALKRNHSVAYAGDLEKFAEKHPDSIYAKRALEATREFRSSGSVKESAPPASAPPSAVTIKLPPKEPASATKPAAKEIAAKETPAKEAPPKSTTSAKLAVSADALEQWQARLVKKLDALAKGGAKVRLPVPNADPCYVNGADDKSLFITIQGNSLPMPWKQLAPGARAALAREAAKENDVEAMIIAAVFQLATGEPAEAEDLFAKASLKDAEAVKAARAELAKPL
jgi:hypothetical protein